MSLDDSRNRNIQKQKTFEKKQKDSGFKRRGYYITDTHVEKINQFKIKKNLNSQHEALRQILDELDLSNEE